MLWWRWSYSLYVETNRISTPQGFEVSLVLFSVVLPVTKRVLDFLGAQYHWVTWINPRILLKWSFTYSLCSGPNYALPQFICWNPNFRCDSIWLGGLWWGWGVRWDHKGEVSWWNSCFYETPKSLFWLSLHHGFSLHTSRRPSSSRQEEGSHQELSQSVPWSWTSQPSDSGQINSCGLSHPVCGILLWQSGLTNATLKSLGRKIQNKRQEVV